jgi:hypothetical protein
MWTVLLGRCWTTERRDSHGLSSSDACALCDQALESIDHLLLQCVFSQEVWFIVLYYCGWHQHSPGLQDCMVEWWLTTRKRVIKEAAAWFRFTHHWHSLEYLASAQ